MIRRVWVILHFPNFFVVITTIDILPFIVPNGFNIVSATAFGNVFDISLMFIYNLMKVAKKDHHIKDSISSTVTQY